MFLLNKKSKQKMFWQSKFSKIFLIKQLIIMLEFFSSNDWSTWIDSTFDHNNFKWFSNVQKLFEKNWNSISLTHTITNFNKNHFTETNVLKIGIWTCWTDTVLNFWEPLVLIYLKSLLNSPLQQKKKFRKFSEKKKWQIVW